MRRARNWWLDSIGSFKHKDCMDRGKQLSAVTIGVNEFKLTCSELYLPNFVLKLSRIQFSKAKLLIQELIFANSKLGFTTS
jgi:hypothetical protein